MRRWGLVAALLFVVLTNAVLWARLAYNRAGEPEATVVLTGREVLFHSEWRGLFDYRWRGREGKRDRPISVRLSWNQDYTPWFDRAKLEALGFDLSMPSYAVKNEYSYYWSLLPRQAYVVLEYDGQGYEAWRREMTEKIASMEEKDREGKLDKWDKRQMENYKNLLAPSSTQSRLFAIDAGTDPAALRRRYPDRQGFIIVAAEVKVAYVATWDEITKKSGPTTIKGVIKQLLVAPIYISSQQRDQLVEITRRFIKPFSEKRQVVKFTICSGRSYEPWVANIRLVEEAK